MQSELFPFNFHFLICYVFMCVRELISILCLTLWLSLLLSMLCICFFLPISVHTLFYSHSMRRALIWHFKVIFKYRNMNIENAIREKNSLLLNFHTFNLLFYILCLCISHHVWTDSFFFIRHTLQTVSANIKGFMCNSSHVKTTTTLTFINVAKLDKHTCLKC